MSEKACIPNSSITFSPSEYWSSPLKIFKASSIRFFLRVSRLPDLFVFLIIVWLVNEYKSVFALLSPKVSVVDLLKSFCSCCFFASKASSKNLLLFTENSNR